MLIEPHPLPCEPAAFAPHLPAEAVERHRRAQQAGVDALNALLGDAATEPPELMDLVRDASGALAAHAAQAWAEDFHWAALRPPVGDGHAGPAGAFAEAIGQAFGDVKRMRERFAEAAARLSGAGWLWLVQRRDGRLAILAAPQSTTPLTGNDTPLLACCLWPHAWAQDNADPRERYLAGFWQLVDWRMVATRMR